MPNRALVVELLLTGAGGSRIEAQGLGTAAAIADHPSNGVVEIVVATAAEAVHEPHALTDPPKAYVPWRGLLNVTIRNVSNGVASVDEATWTNEYAVEVVDSSGKPVPLTDRGKSMADAASKPRDPHGYTGPAARVRLTPGQEINTKMDVSQIYQVAPGTAYTIKIRRTSGLPAADEYGKPLAQRELSCTVTIDGLGVLK